MSCIVLSELRGSAIRDVSDESYSDPALERFCDEFYPQVVGLLRLYLGPSGPAEDLAMDVFAKVCLKWDKIRSVDRPVAYVQTMAINRARSWFRRGLASRRAYARVGPDPEVHNDEDVAEQMVVREAVSRLPERQRRAIVLRYYGGMTTGEVAQALRCPPGTARSLLSRGAAALEAKLGDTSADRYADTEKPEDPHG